MKRLTPVLFACLCTLLQAQSSPALPRSTPEAEGLSSAGLADLVTTLDQKVEDMHGLVIVRHGKVVAEGWWTPYAANEPHLLFSLSKSFTSTAIGLAQSEGKLSVNDPILKFFPDLAPAEPSTNLKAVRIADLLRMSTGHHAEDIDPFPFQSKEDLVKRFLSRNVTDKPGTHFFYNTAATYVLSAIVQKVTGQTVLDYLRPRIFEPLGITDPTWESSAQGISFGGFGLSLRTEEIARFGQLLLQKGEWQGRRLVPAEWIETATARQTSNGSAPDSDWEQGYGYQFWRCRHGFYRGDGAFGQFCIVMPQYDTVVAINSGTKDMGRVMNIVWDHLLPDLRAAALPADDAALAKLKMLLSGLRIPIPTGTATSPFAAKDSGRTFSFETNPAGFESLGFVTAANGHMTFKIRQHGADQQLECDGTSWTKGLFASEPGDPKPCACAGAWTADDTYVLKICEYRTPFIQTVRLHFSGSDVEIAMTGNVGPNSAPTPPLKGHAG